MAIWLEQSHQLITRYAFPLNNGVKERRRWRIPTVSADIQYIIEDQVAVGDKVVTRWSANGTHTGNFLGAPESGRLYTITGISSERVENGKIVC